MRTEDKQKTVVQTRRYVVLSDEEIRQAILDYVISNSYESVEDMFDTSSVEFVSAGYCKYEASVPVENDF